MPHLPPRGNLPATVSTFVGRERECAEIAWLLRSARLVTLVGTGGAGKTRLAQRVGATLASDYADGVWFVELGPLADPALVPQAAAQALGVREQAGRSLVAALVDALARNEALLVLDNCEHVIDALGGAGRRPAARGARAAHPDDQPRAADRRRRSDLARATAGPDRRRRRRRLRRRGQVVRRPRPRGGTQRSRSTPSTGTRSWRSAVDWMACRWESSWRLLAFACSRRARSPTAWTIAFGCSSAAAAPRRRASRRWPRPSTGVTTSCPSRNSACSSGRRYSPTASASRRWRRSSGRMRVATCSTWCRAWSTAR